MSQDDPLDGRIGEAWSGEVPNGSHINVVIARRGSVAYGAVIGALAGPRPGHLPFLACLTSGVVIRPTTVVVNKNSITADSGDLGRITWGAAQLGIAQGVLDCVADGTLPADEVDDLALLVPVWVDPAAHDETAVKAANRAATGAAIRDAVGGTSAADARALAARREEAANMYYEGV